MLRVDFRPLVHFLLPKGVHREQIAAGWIRRARIGQSSLEHFRTLVVSVEVVGKIVRANTAGDVSENSPFSYPAESTFESRLITCMIRNQSANSQLGFWAEIDYLVVQSRAAQNTPRTQSPKGLFTMSSPIKRIVLTPSQAAEKELILDRIRENPRGPWINGKKVSLPKVKTIPQTRKKN